MVLASSTFLSDTIKFLRDQLLANITDPISSTRPSGQKFVMTSYPQRGITYPIITVKDVNISTQRRSGLQSETLLANVEVEVRVWARNVKERDALTEQVHDFLRTNQFGGSNPSTDYGLHDFKMTSAVNVDEIGDNAIKSKVMAYNFMEVV